jgi:2,4-dienoyl-CoA reductase-like NADH-dependent reductase (Old Yellow Enzyme family)
VDRSERKLFTPIQIGPLKREHRLVMAPLTRSRSKPGAVMRQYYTQRPERAQLTVSTGPVRKLFKPSLRIPAEPLFAENAYIIGLTEILG